MCGWTMPVESRTTIEEMGLIGKLSGPVMLSQIAAVGLSTIDVVMAGRMDSEVLAAMGIGNSLTSPTQLFFMGVLMAVNPITAQLFGAGEREKMGSCFRQGLWASAFLCIPGIAFLWSAGPILQLMSIPENLIPLTQGYLRAWSLGLPFCLAFYSIRFFNEGLNSTHAPLYILAAALPLNGLANYALMYGKWGFPNLGVVGLGYATAVVWFFAFLCLLAWTLAQKQWRQYHLIGSTRPRWDQLREIMHIGLPNAVSIGMEISMFALVTLGLGRFGEAVVGAHQIAINIISIVFMIPLGLSIGVSIRVGHMVGMHKKDGVRRSSKAGLYIVILTNIFTMLSVMFLARPLAALYTTDETIVTIAAGLLFYAALFQLSDGVQVVATGALRGLKDTKVPMIGNAVAYWVVGIPLGWYLAISRDMGAPGFWIGLIAGLTVAAFSHMARLLYQIHRHYRN